MKKFPVKLFALVTEILCATVLAVNLFALDSSAELSAFLSRSNDYYNRGNFAKAVDTVNAAIEIFDSDEVYPENVRLMAEAVYYGWINSIYKDTDKVKSRKDFDEAVLQIKLHPVASSTRTMTLLNNMFDREIASLEKIRRTKIDDAKKDEWRKINNEINELNKSKRELELIVSGQTSVELFKQLLAQKKENHQRHLEKICIMIIGVMIFIAILVLIFIIVRNYRRRIYNQRRFETTLEVVALMNNDRSYLSGNETKTVRKPSGDFISKSEISLDEKIIEFVKQDEDGSMLLELQHNCTELGHKIDEVTGRKGNSRKVAELVLKICNVAGLDQNLSLIYYCAAMVYDAGFLAVSREILSAEHLTIKQRYEVRSHVQNAAKYLEFVPEEIKALFMKAAEYHHENYDGNGYLEGLRASKIPLIARMIRVCESYVSLVSRRIYRDIMDNEAAIKELKAKRGIYDEKIVGLLEQVI